MEPWAILMAPDAIREEVPTSELEAILVAELAKGGSVVGEAMGSTFLERLRTDVISSATREIFNPETGLVWATVKSKAGGGETVEKFGVAALYFLARLDVGYLAYRIWRRIIDEIGIFSW